MPDTSLDGGIYVTGEPTITEWRNGDAMERLVIPAGLITDYSSIPNKGVLGWLARLLGVKKEAPYFTRAGKIHDTLYFHVKTRQGILPDGWYQVRVDGSDHWLSVISYQWTRRAADAIWRRVAIEDGCPVPIANRCHRALRLFGGVHMRFS